MAKIKTLLPPNATLLEKDIDQIFAKHIADIGAPNKNVTNPNTCPNPILPWLAWENHVDRWDEAWPEAIRRQLIASSVLLHKHSGTLGAVKQALSVFRLDDVIVQEWFEHAGAPYTFRIFITITRSGFDAASIDDIVELIALSKNARSWLARLQVALSTTSTVPVIAGVCLAGEITTVYPKER